MTSMNTAVWLPRVLFESALITVSILIALGLDEWRQNREMEGLSEGELLDGGGSDPPRSARFGGEARL